MAWIESHQELKNHPKTRHLARELGTSVPAVIGHLHCLWWWAMDYAPDGDLSRWEAADMGDAAMFDGDPDTLIEALINSGFVDENQGNLKLHDWDKYGEKLHRRRQVNAERMRQKRAEERMPEMACNARATHVQNTCIGTGHDSTGHDSTGHESPYNPPLSGGRPADAPLPSRDRHVTVTSPVRGKQEKKPERIGPGYGIKPTVATGPLEEPIEDVNW